MRAVSVLLNVWGGDNPELLDRALISVNQQSLVPDELVVVIDGSISQQLRTTLIRNIEQLPFRVVTKELPTNIGLWFARNVGLETCRNDLVALHDADDIMHPLRLRHQLLALERMGDSISVLGSPVFEFDTSSFDIISARRTIVNRPLISRDFTAKNPIHHSSVILSRAAVSRVGMYRNIPGGEDFDLWRRLIRAGAHVINDSHFLQALGTDIALLNRRNLSRKIIRGELTMYREQFAVTRGPSRISTTIGLAARLLYRATPIPLRSLSQELFLRVRHVEPPFTLNDFLTCEPTSSQ